MAIMNKGRQNNIYVPHCNYPDCSRAVHLPTGHLPPNRIWIQSDTAGNLGKLVSKTLAPNIKHASIKRRIPYMSPLKFPECVMALDDGAESQYQDGLLAARRKA